MVLAIEAGAHLSAAYPAGNLDRDGSLCQSRLSAAYPAGNFGQEIVVRYFSLSAAYPAGNSAFSHEKRVISTHCMLKPCNTIL